ncbi:pentraxin-related protein PTX3 [Eretmochelys imbricata]
MLSLTILLCAFWSSSSALNNEDYDLMYLNFENEIESIVPATEETISCDCQQEPTKWDKLFIMLENSQMKENMLLQSIDEILKVELQTLRAEMIQFVANFAGTCTTTIEKVTSRVLSQVDQTLMRNRDHIQETAKVETGFQPQDKSSYMGRGDNFILNSLREELQKTRAELKGSQKWAAQHLLPAGCETAILFPMRSKKIFGSVHPTVDMMLQSFTACIWVKVTEVLDKTIIFSYGTKRNPYEIQFYLSHDSAVLAVGSDQNKLIAPNTISPGQWAHFCGTWSSDNGTISLWANGELVATSSETAEAYIIPDGGILQVGQEKNGCCVGGGFDETLAFSGKLTGFNIWDRVLSNEEITARPRAEDSCNIRGNVVGWGVTEILPHGGAQYVS